MGTRRTHPVQAAAPFLCLVWFCAAATARPAQGQILGSLATGEVIVGQSISDSASTTVVFLGAVEPGEPTNVLTTRVGFNVNADAGPGLIALEVAVLSFDVRFRVNHPAHFNLIFDFLLSGQLARLADQDGCEGFIELGDISIPTLVRLPDGAEFPLGARLAGASLELETTTSSITLAGQDSRTVFLRDQPVEETDYLLSFQVAVTALSQSCEVSARFGADNGSTTSCDACVYPGFNARTRDDDGLFVTLTLISLCGDGTLDPGEQCDAGALNGLAESCCDAACNIAPPSQVCRPAAGECDESESCNGLSDDCPVDLPKTAGSPCTADSSLCTADVCDTDGACAHPLLAGTTCDDEACTCDHDGLFCTGPLRCAVGGSLCIALPTPCAEDDTCDEDGNVCVSPFGTVTPSPTASPSATAGTPAATPTATPSPATPTATASTSATDATPSPPMATTTSTVTGLTPGTPTATPTVSARCAGDCDGNGAVAINELVIGVNIALGDQSVSACLAFDGDGNGSVAINELIAAVSNTLAGCPI